MDTPIPASIPLEELLALSVLEKIALIGVLWDSIDERDSIPITGVLLKMKRIPNLQFRGK